MKKNILLFMTLSTLLLFIACSKDDGNGTGGSNSSVVVDANGKTSNGSVYSKIDDKNFYLDYIKYTVEEGHLVVSGYDKDGFKGEAIIPSNITCNGNSYEVLKIENNVFWGCNALTTVQIPNSITSIGNAAFYDCNKLKSVTIGKSLTSIGYSAFRNCTSLTSITIPNSVTSIGSDAFVLCKSLTSIVVEENNPVYDSRDNCNAIIETATNTLIKGCSTTIIPNNIQFIGNNAFQGSTGLSSISIPNSVKSIGSDAFFGCI